VSDDLLEELLVTFSVFVEFTGVEDVRYYEGFEIV
jgi:hypothetical protein